MLFYVLSANLICGFLFVFFFQKAPWSLLIELLRKKSQVFEYKWRVVGSWEVWHGPALGQEKKELLLEGLEGIAGQLCCLSGCMLNHRSKGVFDLLCKVSQQLQLFVSVP